MLNLRLFLCTGFASQLATFALIQKANHNILLKIRFMASMRAQYQQRNYYEYHRFSASIYYVWQRVWGSHKEDVCVAKYDRTRTITIKLQHFIVICTRFTMGLLPQGWWKLPLPTGTKGICFERIEIHLAKDWQ